MSINAAAKAPTKPIKPIKNSTPATKPNGKQPTKKPRYIIVIYTQTSVEILTDKGTNLDFETRRRARKYVKKNIKGLHKIVKLK
jgi:hypothetical protein